MAFAFGLTYGTSPAQKLVKNSSVSGIPAQTFTITAATALMDGSTAYSQDVLNMVIETVASNGQPIGITLGASTVKVVLEHASAWTSTTVLATALNTAWTTGGGSGTEFSVS